jgi:hypothetical protein
MLVREPSAPRLTLTPTAKQMREQLEPSSQMRKMQLGCRCRGNKTNVI